MCVDYSNNGFLVVMNWKVNFSKSMLLTCSIEALFTAMVLSYCVWFGGAYSYIQFAKWTELILDHIPELYNPTHEFFIQGLAEREISLFDTNGLF